MAQTWVLSSIKRKFSYDYRPPSRLSKEMISSPMPFQNPDDWEVISNEDLGLQRSVSESNRGAVVGRSDGRYRSASLGDQPRARSGDRSPLFKEAFYLSHSKNRSDSDATGTKSRKPLPSLPTRSIQIFIKMNPNKPLPPLPPNEEEILDTRLYGNNRMNNRSTSTMARPLRVAGEVHTAQSLIQELDGLIEAGDHNNKTPARMKGPWQSSSPHHSRFRSLIVNRGLGFGRADVSSAWKASINLSDRETFISRISSRLSELRFDFKLLESDGESDDTDTQWSYDLDQRRSDDINRPDAPVDIILRVLRSSDGSDEYLVEEQA